MEEQNYWIGVNITLQKNAWFAAKFVFIVRELDCFLSLGQKCWPENVIG